MCPVTDTITSIANFVALLVYRMSLSSTSAPPPSSAVEECRSLRGRGYGCVYVSATECVVLVVKTGEARVVGDWGEDPGVRQKAV